MVQQRDFLMIQVEQVGKVLGKILADLLGVKTSENIETFDIIKEQLYSDLDLNINELIYRTDSDFKNIISRKLLKNTMLYEKFSDILYESGKFYNLNIDKRNLYYSKALLLLEEIVSENQTFSVNLLNKISNLNLKLVEDK